MRIYIIATLFLFCIINGNSQTVDVLPLSEYLNLVRENHPIAYQANLLAKRSNAVSKIARGGFDPKIEGGYDYKHFDNKNYFSLTNGIIKIPTWYGIELKAGYDRNQGQFINNSDQIPTNGLWNAGISIPLGKGLIIDQRRAELQRAKIYAQSTEIEQRLLINQLLYDALDSYLNWQTAYELRAIALEGLALSKQRFLGTKTSYMNGDLPAIDTLESFIAVQVRQQELLKSNLQYENNRLILNNYLWLNGEVPLETDSLSKPEIMNINLLQNQIDSFSLLQELIISDHPELLLYEYKLTDLEIKTKLAKEDLKPDIRVSYNPLLATSEDALFQSFNINDYKVGASLSYPIFQRKERGKLQLNKIEIQENIFSQKIKKQDLALKLNTYINNIRQTAIQYDLNNQTIVNYRFMLDAENKKFSFGESSIFLINSREVKYLESRYKLIENAQKLLSYKLSYLLFTGQLHSIEL